MFKVSMLTASLASMALVACGGGGGGAAPAAAPVAVANAAEGIWGGAITGGDTFLFTILENGETWSLSASATSIGLLSGTTTISGSSATVAGTTFTGGQGSVSSTKGFAATVVPKATLNGVLTPGTTALSTTYDTTYDTAPSLAAVAGSYAGVVGTVKTARSAFALAISATGVVAATSGPCVIAGTATPRASGKGVVNLALTLTGCDFSSATGVAMFDPKTKTLVVMAMNPAKTDGMVFAGVKP